MARLLPNILHTIGRTPIVKINRLHAGNAELFVKCEYFNPLSSVKDRLALAVIEDAERKNLLRPGMTVVEATSGNTGIGLAMVCAQRGYPFVSTMVETFSVERRRIMRALGAKVVLTPAAAGGVGMVKKAEELAAKFDGWFLTKQFVNEANATYHATTTGPEILQAFASKPLSHFVTGYGTGGTFNGVSRVLRAAWPDVGLLLTEPVEAPLVSSKIPQARDLDGSATEPHPAFQPHKIQGWTPNFVPNLCQLALSCNPPAKLTTITLDKAVDFALRLARDEGIFAGISGGATVASAVQLIESLPSTGPPSVVLAMLPDTMERYLSTPLLDCIKSEMNSEELALSQSTPNFQLNT